MSTDHDRSCGECTAADLPVNPFEALRVATGCCSARTTSAP